MTTHGAGQLWTTPDQMPSCTHCLNGDHYGCLDLLETPPWGLHACGCRNDAHKEDGL